jgi:hypothetical protein
MTRLPEPVQVPEPPHAAVGEGVAVAGEEVASGEVAQRCAGVAAGAGAIGVRRGVSCGRAPSTDLGSGAPCSRRSNVRAASRSPRVTRVDGVSGRSRQQRKKPHAGIAGRLRRERQANVALCERASAVDKSVGRRWRRYPSISRHNGKSTVGRS